MEGGDGTKAQLLQELEELHRRLDRCEDMEEEFRELAQRLEDERDRARLYLDIADVILVLIEPSGTVGMINRKGREVLGRKEGEIVGKDWFDNFLPPSSRAEVRAGFERLVAGELDPLRRYENPVLTRTGEQRLISWHNTILRDRDGNVRGTLSSGEDITERRRAERALERYTRRLERSNAELRQFAYAAHHDLREPLRAMSSFAQLLGRRYKGQLDADADEFIEYIVDGAGRMGEMLDGLLEFAGVDEGSGELEPTDSGAALDEAIANLHTAVEDSGAEITRDELAEVVGDHALLVHLFQNLLSNAIKFRGEDPPRVHVGVEATETEWVFSVRDNGIGMAAETAEGMFRIFAREDPEGRSGRGIGLAICRKVVQLHGGRIWVESEPGEGTTVSFTIPGDRPAW